MNITLKDIDVSLPKRQYEASLTKTQVLATLLQCGVNPKYAFVMSGLFYDPTDAYEQSKEILEIKWGKKALEKGNKVSEMQQETVGSRKGQYDFDDKVS